VLLKQRITIPEIKKHEWYLKNLPQELKAENDIAMDDPRQRHEEQRCHQPMQSIETIMQIVSEATIPDPNVLNQLLSGVLDMDMDMDMDMDFEDDDDLDFESSGEMVSII